MRPFILERDGFRCQIRDRRVCENLDGGPLPAGRLEVDHIVPRHQGGSDDPSNLRAVCRPCHHARDRGQTRRGSRVW